MKIQLLDCFTERQPFLNVFNWGKNDLKLMEKLIKAGSEHRKFLRMCVDAAVIWDGENNGEHVISLHCEKAKNKYKRSCRSVMSDVFYENNGFFIPKKLANGIRASRQSYSKIDTFFREKIQTEYCGKSYYYFEIDAPLYFWKHADQYKKDTTTLSDSTMYNIMKRPFEQSDFERPIPEYLLATLNAWRYEKRFTDLVNILPSGYIQKRFFFCNKRVLERIIMQRTGHKLKEWAVIVDEFKRVLEVE